MTPDLSDAGTTGGVSWPKVHVRILDHGYVLGFPGPSTCWPIKGVIFRLFESGCWECQNGNHNPFQPLPGYRWSHISRTMES